MAKSMSRVALGLLASLGAFGCSDEPASLPMAAGGTAHVAGAAQYGQAGTGTAGSMHAAAGMNSAGGSAAGGGGALGGGGSADAGSGGMAGAAAGSGSAGTAGQFAGGAGGGGGAAGGAASPCSGSTLDICEDFEGAAVGSSMVPGWTTQGSVQVVSDQARSGTRSLKVGAKLSGERTIRRTTTRSGSAIPGSHWGRVFYRIETPFPVPGDFVHSVHVFGDGMVNAGKVQVRVFDTIMQSTRFHKFGYNVQRSYGNNSEHGVFTNPDYRYENVWKCAEWRLDSGEQSYHFYVDGSEIKPIAIANAKAYYTGDPEIPTTFSSVSLGWNNFQASTAPGFTAWFDDFALGAARVGCN